MAAVARLDLGHAYPFMGLNFVLVLALSGVLGHEVVTLPKLTGVALIMVGPIVGNGG